MLLSIIIPTYNEERTLVEVISKIIKKENIAKEILVIDDGSKDNSIKVLENNFKDKIILIKNKKNYGKGYSVRQGLSKCNGDLILIQDADLEYDPDDYEKLLKPIIDGKADVVFGSRFRGDGARRQIYFLNQIGNNLISFVCNLFTGLNLSDIEAGYKVFKSQVIKDIKLRENRFGFEPEVVVKCSKKNIRIFEVGISYYGRTYTEGKKIRWYHALQALWCIFIYSLFSK